MYLKAHIEVDQIALVKLIKTNTSNEAGQFVQDDKAVKNDKSLSL